MVINQINIAQFTEIQTYEDCPSDVELLVWTGDSFDIEIVAMCGETGNFYPENGIEFVAFTELPDRDETFVKFEHLVK